MSRCPAAREQMASRFVPWMALFVLLCSIAAALGGELTPQQRRDVLLEAQQHYDRGIAVLAADPAQAKSIFRTAAERFQLVADSGVINGQLYYNLANAYLEAGDLGRAILNYRKAQRLMPGDARLQANLKYARSLCRSQIAPSGERALVQALLGWHEHTSLRARFAVFITCYVAFWIVLLWRLFRPGGALLAAALILGLAALISGASTTSDVFGWGHRPAGVILSDEVTLRKGNGAGFEPQIEQPLHAGVEFDVLEERGDWLNIQLPNGISGWIEHNAVAVIGESQ